MMEMALLLFVHRSQLIVNDLFDLLLAAQNITQLRDVALELLDVPGAIEDVFLVDVTQLDLRDELRLNLVDPKALHEIGHDVAFQLRAANDGDGLVDVEKDGLQAVKQMQAIAFLLQVKLRMYSSLMLRSLISATNSA